MDESERPSKVIFVVITDGLENASREYTRDQINTLIARQRDQWKWGFVFLGANMDAVAEAGNLGILRDSSISYRQSGRGTQSVYAAMSAGVTAVRSGAMASVSFTSAQRSSSMTDDENEQPGVSN